MKQKTSLRSIIHLAIGSLPLGNSSLWLLGVAGYSLESSVQPAFLQYASATLHATNNHIPTFASTFTCCIFACTCMRMRRTMR